MLRVIFVLVSILTAASHANATALQVERPRIVTVATTSELRQLCGIGRPIDACTQFVGYALSATCNASNGLWTMSASARFTPLLYVLAPAAVRHEYMHISDLQQSTSGYLQSLSARTFDTNAGCEAASLVEVERFEARFTEFVAASTAFRHPGGR